MTLFRYRLKTEHGDICIDFTAKYKTRAGVYKTLFPQQFAPNSK